MTSPTTSNRQGANTAIAAGIDLGGTKIEAQVFDESWQVIDKKRVATPGTYPALLAALSGLMTWSERVADRIIPVGIGAAGLINPATGLVLSANICATGRPLPADIATAAGRPVSYINDCRALALSEAVFGAGQGHKSVLSVILGTGIGGGLALDGALRTGPSGTGGEIGHCAAPAAIVAQHNLPVVACGCGRTGCIETYIAGPGLERLARALLGTDMSARAISAQRHSTTAPVWQVWCALTADLLRTLILTLDPDVIVLGGGLSTIDGVEDDLFIATQNAHFAGFTPPPIVLAQGGDASGARGAAYAAWQAT